jgi:Helicase conserved C-terminal domain
MTGPAMSYPEFLAAKSQFDGAAGFDPLWLPDALFGFQQAMTTWAIWQGRGALFADCGLGKSPMQLTWAQNVHQHTGRPVLVVTPLAVSFQTEAEARKFGIDAAISRDGSIPAPVVITNYERLEHFEQARFGGVVCDESSAIKSFDGTRKAIVTEFMRQLPYRLLCTATAAPNDYVELGTSSEALGYLGYMDMLGRFFVNNARTSAGMKGKWRDGSEWRFKGHAEDPFWRWVASWARAARKPSDLGYADDGFALPALEQRRHVVEARMPKEGTLFDVPAAGLHEEREESRRTLTERCEKAAELLADATPGVAWCQLNAESTLLTRLIDGAVELTGAASPDEKEAILAAFSRGEIRVLVTKPSIGAWGLNWQHCHRVTFFPTHSYEQYYQAVRRCWRFGQQHPVVVDIVTTPGGANIFRNLERKAAQAERMFDALTSHMRDALTVRRAESYEQEAEVPLWAAS